MADRGGATQSAMTTPSPVPDLNRNRLPTLFEVLSRRTLPPVDLFSFYIFMRDQQRSVDYLDFWYDIPPLHGIYANPRSLPFINVIRELTPYLPVG